ncbi:MAG: glycosyltransferase [Elainellaceae cyanobacterium]
MAKKVALVHDYLTQAGGAERVFELLCKRFPDADIFTSLYDPSRTIDLSERSVKTTFLQSIPGANHYFRLLAPFYYPAFQALDLQSYDLIISSTSSFAKSVRKRSDAYHICFCHNVTRFLWDTETYLREYRDFQKFYPILEKIFSVMRKADLHYGKFPDLYIANSSTVARRIRNIYDKEVHVVNYPINVSQFQFSEEKDDYYLVSSRLLSYKKVDIIVETFNRLGWKLIVTGQGPEMQRLKKMASNNIQFLGHVSDEKRRELFAKAKGVIVAALEDYGLVPIEANACGTPTITYGEGGVLDTQISGKTGIFFKQQTPESLTEALHQAEKMYWDASYMRNHALTHFTESVFFDKVDKVLDNVYGNRKLNLVS